MVRIRRMVRMRYHGGTKMVRMRSPYSNVSGHLLAGMLLPDGGDIHRMGTVYRSMYEQGTNTEQKHVLVPCSYHDAPWYEHGTNTYGTNVVRILSHGTNVVLRWYEGGTNAEPVLKRFWPSFGRYTASGRGRHT